MARHAERRSSNRENHRIRVALYYGPIGLLPCSTQDLSPDGMSVRTAAINLGLNADLEAVFTCPENLRERLRIKARVVRTTADGAALRFISPSRRARALIDRLLATQAAPTTS